MSIKFIDLFSGIGGFHQALKELGHECVFASEIDSHAATIYKENHQLEPAGDITKIHASKIPTHDLLCAGFPCQSFSVSGKQKGFEDTRGNLFFEITRILEHHSPKFFLLENVKNIITHDKGKTFNTIINTLEGLGYKVFTKLINASEFKTGQARERVYFVGIRKDISTKKFSFPKKLGYKSVLDVVENLHEKGIKREDYLFSASSLTLGNSVIEKPRQIGIVNKGGQGERIYDATGQAITLSASGGGVGAKTGLYLIGNSVRRLTTRECARLQGFPEHFIIDKKESQAYKQFGNAVCVPVVKSILKNLLN
ncbi:DNA cytosine methyltransferase [Flammeovirga agarivorans]|uniref:Cytosine-specific methyltransferase n=1 Tax=Flammeovirga agarivorans TaxID=2726742 RepID=A0A7X8SRA5_9BACT|nr:DNA (cytosine-5-)-methyltransferase [Flammeovirga agarivorans]NLR94950.1 DNA (cytosine-5-)-methyltransferase [Flammeovirga agarivorans]